MIVNIAVLGCGRLFEHYARQSFNEMPNNWKISLLIENNPVAAESAKSKYPNAIHKKTIEDSIEELSSIDIAFILTPSGLHYEHALAFIKKGINVVVEKPICMQQRQIRDIYYQARQHKCKIFPVFQNRFNNALCFAKNCVENGSLGRIINIATNVRWHRDKEYYDSSSWRGTWKFDGGVINNQAIHHIDAYVWLAGLPSNIYTINKRMIHDIECEDTSISVMQHTDGYTSTFTATTTTPFQDLEASIEIYGTDGYIKVGGIALNRIDFIRTKQGRTYPSEINEFAKDGYGNGHISVIRHIINAITNNVEYPITEDDAVKTATLVNNMYLSSYLDSKIDVNESNNYEKLGE